MLHVAKNRTKAKGIVNPLNRFRAGRQHPPWKGLFLAASGLREEKQPKRKAGGPILPRRDNYVAAPGIKTQAAALDRHH